MAKGGELRVRTTEQIAADIRRLLDESTAPLQAGQDSLPLVEPLSMGFASISSHAMLVNYGPEGGKDAMETLIFEFSATMREAFTAQCLGNKYADPYGEQTHNEQTAAQILKEIKDD